MLGLRKEVLVFINMHLQTYSLGSQSNRQLCSAVADFISSVLTDEALQTEAPLSVLTVLPQFRAIWTFKCLICSWLSVMVMVCL